MKFCIIEYDAEMDAHFVPPIKPYSEWRLRLARWLLGCDQDDARERLRGAIARSGRPCDAKSSLGPVYSWWTTPTGEDATAFAAANDIRGDCVLLHAQTGIVGFSQVEPGTVVTFDYKVNQ